LIADDVRRLLIEAGVDQGQVLWHDAADAPKAPSHRWIAWSVGDEIILGGADHGRFAPYARFGDPTLVAEILQRWVAPRLAEPPRDDETFRDAALVVADDLIGSGAADGTVRDGGVVSGSVLPVGAPLDHVGNASGHVLHLYGTSFSARSLPPTDLNADRIGFVLTTALPEAARVSLAPAWFGQPGGGVTITLDRVIAYYVDTGVLAPFAVETPVAAG
jgi:hypothetical protein